MPKIQIKLGAGMTLHDDGGSVIITHAKSKWQINAEHYFRKARINVETLNRNRLFRKMGLKAGTEQEFMEYHLSHGKALSGKKQEKFIAGIIGTANPNLMQDMMIWGRATTEKGQGMLADAILKRADEFPEESMIGILTIQRYASLKPSVEKKIEDYLAKHCKEAGIGRMFFEKRFLAQMP